MIVVWFKRDLRLQDHEPLISAMKTGQPILLCYSFEPLWTSDRHYSELHLNFIKQSLLDLNQQLKVLDTEILVVSEDFPLALDKIHQIKPISRLFSHQETGMKITYDRDKAVNKWCKDNDIEWKEFVQNGVFRGIKNRKEWKDHWMDFMNRPLATPNLKKGDFMDREEITKLCGVFDQVKLETPNNPKVQGGGPITAHKYLASFFKERIAAYNSQYSKPLTSRLHSSRLSPYLAWGNLSTRQVVQYAIHQDKKVNKRNLNAFLSRMRWQAHFVQKFEMEGAMEFHSINKGYHILKKEVNKELQEAWKKGQTGVPMVDAAMRCLMSTGFINFRLRALLASFFTHLLWQPWQDCTEHLAQHFLDFEPGIHFPQLNMQSGETGINTIRIYNPVKNGKEHDPKGTFIKKWVPELMELPEAYVHEPWKIPKMEQIFLGFELGKHYPWPIVDIDKMRTYASDVLYAIKKNWRTKVEGNRIIEKHTLPGRPVWDNQV
ncbi:MAG: deoxyribodipyrimidine photo-lyase/cryptochrome family protein [Croceivirga sp.]|mgnify:CR=1 FL=1